MLKYKWFYDPTDETWKFGTPNDGAGVYYIDDHGKNHGKWTGNVISPNALNVQGIGYFDTCTEAQEAAEKEYASILYDEKGYY